MADSFIYTPQQTSSTHTIYLPASKSISNRLLIIKALSGYLEGFENLSEADDTKRLLNILQHVNQPKHNAGLGGTTFRFLTAYLSLLRGEFTLTAEGKMLERPIGPLVSALNQLGADIQYLETDGFPPIKINRGNMHGGNISIDTSVSSQFVSAIMLIAPYLTGGVTVSLSGKVASMPYIKMTAAMMTDFGINVTISENEICIEEGCYKNKTYFVENDWSAASYIYQAFVLNNYQTKIKLPFLYKNSLQGDKAIAEIYAQFGIETIFHDSEIIITKKENFVLPDYFEYDFSDTPDLAQTIAVTCVCLGIKAKLTGLQTLQHKETNRLLALKNELEKTGTTITATNSELKINPPKTLLTPQEINTYNDHRMAMAFSGLIFKLGKLTFNNASVVSKSFPNFWETMQQHFGIEKV